MERYIVELEKVAKICREVRAAEDAARARRQ